MAVDRARSRTADEEPAAPQPPAQEVTPSLDRLEADLVQVSIAHLGQRIAARFPARNLVQVAAQLADLADEVEDTSGASRTRLRIARWVSTVLGLAITAATVLIVVAVLRQVRVELVDGSADWVPLVESGINDVVFAGIAIWFLLALPARFERARILALLHRLRSLAHVIDMHQLTKDPEHLNPNYSPTGVSVRDPMSREEMAHYLDYCSELLSLTGKVAALCAEASEDDVILDTVAGVESLTSDLAARIWQKISLLPD